jgi:hypothetical protein
LKGLELGSNIKGAELRQPIEEDPAYMNLTMEEEEQMKKDVLELRERKKIGARPQTNQRLIGNVTGYPGVFWGNPHPYP